MYRISHIDLFDFGLILDTLSYSLLLESPADPVKFASEADSKQYTHNIYNVCIHNIDTIYTQYIHSICTVYT